MKLLLRAHRLLMHTRLLLLLSYYVQLGRITTRLVRVVFVTCPRPCVSKDGTPSRRCPRLWISRGLRTARTSEDALLDEVVDCGAVAELLVKAVLMSARPAPGDETGVGCCYSASSPSHSAPDRRAVQNCVWL